MSETKRQKSLKIKPRVQRPLQTRHSFDARPDHVACIRNVTERVPHERNKLNSNHEQHENRAVNLDCRENGQDLSRDRARKPNRARGHEAHLSMRQYLRVTNEIKALKTLEMRTTVAKYTVVAPHRSALNMLFSCSTGPMRNIELKHAYARNVRAHQGYQC